MCLALGQILLASVPEIGKPLAKSEKTTKGSCRSFHRLSKYFSAGMPAHQKCLRIMGIYNEYSEQPMQRKASTSSLAPASRAYMRT